MKERISKSREIHQYLHCAQNGDIAPDGGDKKWGRTVARTRHCDCCPREGIDDYNQRRLAAAWNATRHLSITTLERMAERRRPK